MELSGLASLTGLVRITFSGIERLVGKNNGAIHGASFDAVMIALIINNGNVHWNQRIRGLDWMQVMSVIDVDHVAGEIV